MGKLLDSLCNIGYRHIWGHHHQNWVRTRTIGKSCFWKVSSKSWALLLSSCKSPLSQRPFEERPLNRILKKDVNFFALIQNAIVHNFLNNGFQKKRFWMQFLCCNFYVKSWHEKNAPFFSCLFTFFSDDPFHHIQVQEMSFPFGLQWKRVATLASRGHVVVANVE